MAKKPQKLIPLTLAEIILRGDADTIRQALEARTQIDTLLEEREAAYRRIAELETQVCEIVGEDGVFPFPEPPMPVATFTAAPAKKKPAPKVEPETPVEAPEATDEETEQADATSTSEEDVAPEKDAPKTDEA